MATQGPKPTLSCASNFKTNQEQMNTRRVHELMRAHFPATGTEGLRWTNLVDERSVLIEERSRVVLLNQFVERNVAEVLVEVHRKAWGTHTCQRCRPVPPTPLRTRLHPNFGPGIINVRCPGEKWRRGKSFVRIHHDHVAPR